MNPKEIMVIALNAEADRIAAGIIESLREALSAEEAGYVHDVQPLQASLEPRFWGAGGEAMRRRGTHLICDWQHANFRDLSQAALAREPDLILCVGEDPLHHRLAESLKRSVRHHAGTFCNWEATIALVDLTPENHAHLDRGDFDEVINPHDGQAIASLPQMAARRVVELLERQMAHFPLKASLASSVRA